MRRHLSTILKLLITVAGLAFVLTQIDLQTLTETLRQTSPGWLLLTFVLINVGLVVRAYRWLVLLRGLDVNIKLSRLTALYYVGTFFNSFLPTSFGGDVMRIVEVARDVPGGVAAGTVILDRLTGLLMLFIMALLALPFRPANFPDSLLWLVVGVSVAGLVTGAVLLEGSLIVRFDRWLPAPLSPTGSSPVSRVLRAVNAVGWSAVSRALLISLMFNLILVAWWWTSARALGYNLPLTFLLLVIPILSITLLVPAVGGFGPREAVATVLFNGSLAATGTSLPSGTGFALSALVFLLERLPGILGGFVYLGMSLRSDAVDGNAIAGENDSQARRLKTRDLTKSEKSGS
ncbi:MAG: lysylphosphatidylglycerol synthase transmembrane domain-containing protein [Chloroflexota bacterium]